MNGAGATATGSFGVSNTGAHDGPYHIADNNGDQHSQSTQTRATGSASASQAPRNGAAEEEAQWSLKDIYWKGRECKIITQNKNGPCSLIALCNILLLRGELQITPPDRPVVSYEYLSQLIAEHLLTKAGDGQGLEEALSILPRTQYGLDVDVGFDSISSFNASSSDGGKGELALFRLCGVPLVHGWLPDPADSETYQAVQAAGSYNCATDIVVQGDEAANGGVVRDRGVGILAATLASDSTVSNGKQAARNDWTDEQRSTIRQALALQSFLDTASTQLTYHGLFVLAQELPADTPVALFRNSHLSVLYKRLPHQGVDEGDAAAGIAPPPTLFTLATDSSFLLEDEIVWESLVDVDGASSEFYDGNFRKSTMRQGDYVGRDANGLGGSGGGQQNEDADYALAMQIYQNDQDRLQRQQQRRAARRDQRPSLQARQRSQQEYRQQQQQHGQMFASMPTVVYETPKEVFTTMRYEAEPRQDDDADALVVSTLIPAQLRDEHRDLLGGLQGLSIGHSNAPAAVPAAVQLTNPFMTASEDTASNFATAAATNPFLSNVEARASAVASNSVQRHRLYSHIPLLEQHLERLRLSAGAMCRAYSSVWLTSVLDRERALESERILEAIESSLASSTEENAPGTVKGIRVAIDKGGAIKVTHRNISPFPSTLENAAVAARLPAVRFDFMPTRVRTMDLEPLVFNKTDARGFYESAKHRVGADPSVLSGVNADERCFDVILWNDEQTDIVDGSNAPMQPKRLVTESSLANIIVEYKRRDGSRSRFVTPRTSTGMLDGLLRRWMVNKGLVEEEDVEVDHVYRSAREGSAQIWLCNSLRGVWRVEVVDGNTNWTPPVAPVPVPPPVEQGKAGKKDRFSQLMKRNLSDREPFKRDIFESSSGGCGPSAQGSAVAPLGEQAPPNAVVHEQVIDDLYGHRQDEGAKLKANKGKKGKDKDCIIM